MASSVQQGIQDSLINYYDIMIIGKTGIGKSTTADKLLIANPDGKKYSGAQHSDFRVDHENHKIAMDDISIWLLSDAADEIDRVKTRLKNLVFFRGLDKSHNEVNMSRENVGPVTMNCELYSNESSKIRVLDVPGFFGGEDMQTPASQENPCSDVSLDAQKVCDNGLGIMRKILHIQTAMNMKFNRIVYFLPVRGSITRADAELQMEVGLMAHYFGRSIFESMVLIATFPSETYKFIQEGQELFNHENISQTKKFFHDVLKRVFQKREGNSTRSLPDPPIVFVSMFDSCDTILQNMQAAEVQREQLQLAFHPETCSRCAMTTGTCVIKGSNVKVACCFGGDWSQAIPYQESTCHPYMIPKYSMVKKFVGGVTHLITFNKFEGRWPGFHSTDEVCIACKSPPNLVGCMQIGQNYQLGKKRGDIKVDHSSTLDKVVFQMPDLDDEEENTDDNNPPTNEPASDEVAKDSSPPTSEPASVQQVSIEIEQNASQNLKVQGYPRDQDDPDIKG